MNNFKTYLEEGRDAPLYHAAYVHVGDKILKENILKGNTDHKFKEKDKIIYKKGVSLTRNFKFAKIWLATSVIFELDQRKLAQRHKIIPFDWWKNTHKSRSEAEEFIIDSIKNIDKYILRLMIDNYAIKHMEKNFRLSNLSKHPLLWNYDKKEWVNGK